MIKEETRRTMQMLWIVSLGVDGDGRILIMRESREWMLLAERDAGEL